jgi:hypothetical protein
MEAPMARAVLRCIVIAFVFLVPATIDADTSTSKGPIGSFKAKQTAPAGSADFACTSSLEFVRMPGVALSFTLAEAARVVLMFQGQFGEFTSTANARVVLRMTVDGDIAGAAVAVGSDPGTGLQTFGFNSVSTLLSAGPHTVEVLWHTFPADSTICVEERSLIVLMP